jgi:hypothetical protein
LLWIAEENRMGTLESELSLPDSPCPKIKGAIARALQFVNTAIRKSVNA